MLYFEVISRTAPFGWKILPGRRPRNLEYFYMTKTLPDNFYITRKRQSVQFGWILFRMRGVVWNSEAKRFCPASSEVALHDIARCQMYEKATHHTYLSSLNSLSKPHSLFTTTESPILDQMISPAPLCRVLIFWTCLSCSQWWSTRWFRRLFTMPGDLVFLGTSSSTVPHRLGFARCCAGE